jgi:hypothetical protein
MKFVKPGSVRINITGQDSSLVAYAFCSPEGNMVISGRNNCNNTITVNGMLSNLPVMKKMNLIYTDATSNLLEGNEIVVSGNSFKASIPAQSVFTITGISGLLPSSMNQIKPEPSGWYPGDIHVHRNCGEVTSVLAESEFANMMETNDLAVISVLADMGNGEVKDSWEDLPKVTGKDAVQSRPGRLVHWDAEWHFDPAGVTFENKALGGHLVLLGLKEAHTIWNESPYEILLWAKKQDAVTGFCHMQYLNDTIQNELNCCIPLEYPVEAALGTIDFLSEDVWRNDAAINAYYRLLNCGFRLGLAAGTDFPCNNSQPFGSLLTYVEVKDNTLTYRNWIEGIRNGRTVVTTNGHVEFLALSINDSATPGDEIKISKGEPLQIVVTWTSNRELTGSIELVCNGKVVATNPGTAQPGKPVTMHATLTISESSWICARRMDDTGHQSHTAPVFVSVDNMPVRASDDDANYFIVWIDNLIEKTSPGGPWNRYFTSDLDEVQGRYRKARAVFEKISAEAGAQPSSLSLK